MSDYYGHSKLVGMKVMSMSVEEHGNSMTLMGEQNGEPVTYIGRTEADCCSSSWIEGVYEESSLIGHTITKVEDIDAEMPGGPEQPGGEDSYEYFKYYGLAIYTEAGRFVIDYRNSSNGYYGGWIEFERA